MKYTCHHTDKWIFANTDLAEEQLEKSSKALIIIAGASSSGKSFLAAKMKISIETSPCMKVKAIIKIDRTR